MSLRNDLYFNVSEAEIKKFIVHDLARHKLGFFWVQNNTGIYNEKTKGYMPLRNNSVLGVFDILGTIYYRSLVGRSVAIEVKTKKEYEFANKLYNKIKLVDKTLAYMPRNKKEKHLLDQILFGTNILEKKGIAFFSYSSEHTVKKICEAEQYGTTELF